MKFVLLYLCMGHLVAFDMWEVIMEKNKPEQKKGILSDENAAVVVGGDILRSPREERRMADAILASPGLTSPVDWHRKLWKRTIPYKIDRSLGSEESQKIRKSLKMISDVSCLRFRTHQYNDKNWIEFYRGNGCFSGIGRKYWEKLATRISIGSGCDNPSIIVHEVFHALGFYHEQSRFDRDSYLKIYLGNALKQMHSNFDKNDNIRANNVGTEYDYKSIMHYSRSAFRKSAYVGNVMEAKFDPEMKLGGNVMSPTDIKELNGLYQCNVKSGWSKLSGWTRCIKHWRGQCLKSNVQFCVSENLKYCPGADEYGTKENVKLCEPEECTADMNRVDGLWGNWGPYTKCSKPCNWGSQTRTRKCDNPAPVSGGKACKGSSLQKTPCRITRCTKASQVDQDFEKGFGGWTSNLFVRKTGKASTSNGGPAKDHTSEVQGATGWYAMVEKTGWGKKKASLTSPEIQADYYPGTKCITFFYQMNGYDIPEENVLSVYLKFTDGTTDHSLPFSQGGHQGNYWKGAEITLKNMKKRFQIVIETRLDSHGNYIVGVDDILFDHAGCSALKDDAKPKVNPEPKPVEKNSCKPDNKGYLKKCPQWAKKGECSKNKWMWSNCCMSCKKFCNNNKDYLKKCPGWASKGECSKNKWMVTNCCRSCMEHKKKGTD